MKKILTILAISIIIVSLFFIVSNQVKYRNQIKPFVGEWSCRETPLEDKDYYTGYLGLYIEDNGEFSMYDIEAGNPGISGKIYIESDREMILKCDESDDFDPPATWSDMECKQVITYNFISKNELQLVFKKGNTKSTLVFDYNEK